MAKVTNPFIVQGYIPEEYFCDREEETKRVVRYLTNGNNIVLSAPRRVGKSKLIEHCFVQPEIKDNYYTIFVDIMQTGNLQEFTYELGKAIFDVTASLGSKMKKLFAQTVRSLQGDFGFDYFTNQPKFSLSLGNISNPQYTIEEIFNFLEEADKPCIVAIDEFQRIAQYPEKNVEAILRTHIQRLHNCHFIYSGSEYHLLGQMFLDYNRPFYQSSTMMTLEKIERSKYGAFAVEHFEEFGKHIDIENVNRVYDLFDGNTFAMHKTLNTSFSITSDGTECDLLTIHKAIDNILGESEHDFRTRLMPMSLPQKEVLYAIARSGIAMQITGAEFVKKFHLGSPSSVQSAVRKLLSDGWIAEIYNNDGKKCYQLNDMFLMLWIQQTYGEGYVI
ncbi:MAG: ATPase [Paludibacteraceae bacterium]|nr:ATPase [Paludibacteraceae bacterium]